MIRAFTIVYVIILGLAIVAMLAVSLAHAGDQNCDIQCYSSNGYTTCSKHCY